MRCVTRTVVLPTVKATRVSAAAASLSLLFFLFSHLLFFNDTGESPPLRYPKQSFEATTPKEQAKEVPVAMSLSARCSAPSTPEAVTRRNSMGALPCVTPISAVSQSSLVLQFFSVVQLLVCCRMSNRALGRSVSRAEVAALTSRSQRVIQRALGVFYSRLNVVRKL